MAVPAAPPTAVACTSVPCTSRVGARLQGKRQHFGLARCLPSGLRRPPPPPASPPSRLLATSGRGSGGRNFGTGDPCHQRVVAAARDLNIQAPIVVRMEGTNVDLGRKILVESGLNFAVGLNMRDAAEQVVKLAA